MVNQLIAASGKVGNVNRANTLFLFMLAQPGSMLANPALVGSATTVAKVIASRGDVSCLPGFGLPGAFGHSAPATGEDLRRRLLSVPMENWTLYDCIHMYNVSNASLPTDIAAMGADKLRYPSLTANYGTYASAIDALCRCNKLEEAWSVFSCMQPTGQGGVPAASMTPQADIYHSFLTCYSKAGDLAQFRQVLGRMDGAGISTTDETIGLGIGACFNAGNLAAAAQIFEACTSSSHAHSMTVSKAFLSSAHHFMTSCALSGTSPLVNQGLELVWRQFKSTAGTDRVSALAENVYLLVRCGYAVLNVSVQLVTPAQVHADVFASTVGLVLAATRCLQSLGVGSMPEPPMRLIQLYTDNDIPASYQLFCTVREHSSIFTTAFGRDCKSGQFIHVIRQHDHSGCLSSGSTGFDVAAYLADTGEVEAAEGIVTACVRDVAAASRNLPNAALAMLRAHLAQGHIEEAKGCLEALLAAPACRYVLARADSCLDEMTPNESLLDTRASLCVALTSLRITTSIEEVAAESLDGIAPSLACEDAFGKARAIANDAIELLFGVSACFAAVITHCQFTPDALVKAESGALAYKEFLQKNPALLRIAGELFAVGIASDGIASHNPPFMNPESMPNGTVARVDAFSSAVSAPFDAWIQCLKAASSTSLQETLAGISAHMTDCGLVPSSHTLAAVATVWTHHQAEASMYPAFDTLISGIPAAIIKCWHAMAYRRCRTSARLKQLAISAAVSSPSTRVNAIGTLTESDRRTASQYASYLLQCEAVVRARMMAAGVQRDGDRLLQLWAEYRTDMDAARVKAQSFWKEISAEARTLVHAKHSSASNNVSLSALKQFMLDNLKHAPQVIPDSVHAGFLRALQLCSGNPTGALDTVVAGRKNTASIVRSAISADAVVDIARQHVRECVEAGLVVSIQVVLAIIRIYATNGLLHDARLLLRLLLANLSGAEYNVEDLRLDLRKDADSLIHHLRFPSTIMTPTRAAHDGSQLHLMQLGISNHGFAFGGTNCTQASISALLNLSRTNIKDAHADAGDLSPEVLSDLIYTSGCCNTRSLVESALSFAAEAMRPAKQVPATISVAAYFAFCACGEVSRADAMMVDTHYDFSWVNPSIHSSYPSVETSAEVRLAAGSGAFSHSGLSLVPGATIGGAMLSARIVGLCESGKIYEAVSSVEACAALKKQVTLQPEAWLAVLEAASNLTCTQLLRCPPDDEPVSLADLPYMHSKFLLGEDSGKATASTMREKLNVQHTLFGRILRLLPGSATSMTNELGVTELLAVSRLFGRVGDFLSAFMLCWHTVDAAVSAQAEGAQSSTGVRSNVSLGGQSWPHVEAALRAFQPDASSDNAFSRIHANYEEGTKVAIAFTAHLRKRRASGLPASALQTLVWLAAMAPVQHYVQELISTTFLTALYHAHVTAGIPVSSKTRTLIRCIESRIQKAGGWAEVVTSEDGKAVAAEFAQCSGAMASDSSPTDYFDDEVERTVNPVHRGMHADYLTAIYERLQAFQLARASAAQQLQGWSRGESESMTISTAIPCITWRTAAALQAAVHSKHACPQAHYLSPAVFVSFLISLGMEIALPPRTPSGAILEWEDVCHRLQQRPPHPARLNKKFFDARVQAVQLRLSGSPVSDVADLLVRYAVPVFSDVGGAARVSMSSFAPIAAPTDAVKPDTLRQLENEILVLQIEFDELQRTMTNAERETKAKLEAVAASKSATTLAEREATLRQASSELKSQEVEMQAKVATNNRAAKLYQQFTIGMDQVSAERDTLTANVQAICVGISRLEREMDAALPKLSEVQQQLAALPRGANELASITTLRRKQDYLRSMVEGMAAAKIVMAQTRRLTLQQHQQSAIRAETASAAHEATIGSAVAFSRRMLKSLENTRHLLENWQREYDNIDAELRVNASHEKHFREHIATLKRQLDALQNESRTDPPTGQMGAAAQQLVHARTMLHAAQTRSAVDRKMAVAKRMEMVLAGHRDEGQAAFMAVKKHYEEEAAKVAVEFEKKAESTVVTLRDTLQSEVNELEANMVKNTDNRKRLLVQVESELRATKEEMKVLAMQTSSLSHALFDIKSNGSQYSVATGVIGGVHMSSPGTPGPSAAVKDEIFDILEDTVDEPAWVLAQLAELEDFVVAAAFDTTHKSVLGAPHPSIVERIMDVYVEEANKLRLAAASPAAITSLQRSMSPTKASFSPASPVKLAPQVLSTVRSQAKAAAARSNRAGSGNSPPSARHSPPGVEYKSDASFTASSYQAAMEQELRALNTVIGGALSPVRSPGVRLMSPPAPTTANAKYEHTASPTPSSEMRGVESPALDPGSALVRDRLFARRR
jgi:pentatricopeptide repeat protein